ncbi:MAG: putative endonuclease [Myxococcota bacterium]
MTKKFEPGSRGQLQNESKSAATRASSAKKPEAPGPQSKDKRRALGAEGEQRAASFLARRGYRIVGRNVRYGGVEIDLIVRRGLLVAFVEVKTRTSLRYGRPECAVDRGKQARIVRAAHAWLSEHRGFVQKVRFDVIACHAPGYASQGEWQIEHIVAAFDAGD